MPTPIKLPVKVENILHHASGLKSFIMNPLKHCPNFAPGQFLHLAIDEYDPSFHWPESRVFSIANSPTRLDKLRITFTVKGRFTRRMYEDVNEGDVLWLKLPYGSFSFPNSGTDIVLIAGGTGITPFVSFLEYTIDNEIDTKIRLYYGIRSPKYLIFDSLFDECKKVLKNFKCHIFIENNVNKSISGIVSKGKLSIQTILSDTAGNRNVIYYLSGPQSMISSFKNILMANNIFENKIIVDEWE